MKNGADESTALTDEIITFLRKNTVKLLYEMVLYDKFMVCMVPYNKNITFLPFLIFFTIATTFALPSLNIELFKKLSHTKFFNCSLLVPVNEPTGSGMSKNFSLVYVLHHPNH